MKVMLFGGTGMLGQSVLMECVKDPAILEVLSISRKPLQTKNDKVNEIILPNLFDLSSIEDRLGDYDACFFCLGVSAAGMSEAQYTKITYDLTMAVADTLVKVNPNLTFIYVSGAGTDSSEQSKFMWARVKGKVESSLLTLPFKQAFMLRPSVIIPVNGVRSNTIWYQLLYNVIRPFSKLLLKNKSVITSEHLGKSLIYLAKNTHEKAVLESADIKKLL